MCVHEIVLISFMGYIMKISYSIKYYMSTYINWTKNLYKTQSIDIKILNTSIYLCIYQQSTYLPVSIHHSILGEVDRF